MQIENITKANELAKHSCGKFLNVTIEIADTYLTDLMPLLRKNKQIFRQELKQLAKSCCYNKHKTGLHDVTQILRSHSPFPDVYATYVDACYDVIRNDIFMLELAIQREMMRRNLPNYELFAKMETLRVLLFMSANAFDDIFVDIRNKCNLIYSYEGFLNYYGTYNIRHVAQNWQKFVTLTFKRHDHGINVNLNDPADIKLAYTILLKRYKEAKFLDKGAEATIIECDIVRDYYNELNPENPIS